MGECGKTNGEKREIKVEKLFVKKFYLRKLKKFYLKKLKKIMNGKNVEIKKSVEKFKRKKK
ncbi:hypothetical protein RFI_35914 [Reticulomyxa filosa]|uniref:Uncharacterized protein n=1 Tax=Reticulomyxa filosa TaxID=46433 RepID=X6LJI9_RETFI|nr:hypothetical protein RFI_35914 [Reticulomyxa filosa]|eukprot:ETO01526.1 hypothetical protein RFI_35914 [Reticulomyxa filosa]